MKTFNYLKFYFQLTVLFFVIFKEVYAQPEHVHLSWSENKGKTSSAMTISWTSTNLKSDGSVFYAKFPSSFSVVKANKTVTEGLAFYKVTLKHLSPYTTYTYRCGSDMIGWIENKFTTAPSFGQRKAFKIGIWGDTQNNEFNEHFEKTTQIVNHMVAYNPCFTLHMGDIVNNGSITSDWLKFLEVSQPLNSIAPMMPTLGNHDIENLRGENFQKPFASFPLLFNLLGDGLNYSFDYGNVHFICIFSGVAQTASTIGQLRYHPGSMEYNWLEKDLAKARKNNHTDWIIAYTHHSVYSFGWSNVAQWKENLSPLFDKYQVDLCLSGHRHVYERHHPVKSGKSVPDGKGTIYITNGSAGGSLQGLGGKEMPTMAFTANEKVYTYAIVTIEGKKLKYEVFNQEGVKIDELKRENIFTSDL